MNFEQLLVGRDKSDEDKVSLPPTQNATALPSPWSGEMEKVSRSGEVRNSYESSQFRSERAKRVLGEQQPSVQSKTSKKDKKGKKNTGRLGVWESRPGQGKPTGNAIRVEITTEESHET